MFVAAVCAGLSGCGSLALSSGEAPLPLEIHSRNCAGLAIERHERGARIVALEASVDKEMQVAATNLQHVLLRSSATPERGTASYADLEAERSRLREADAVAVELRCPAATIAKVP